MDILPRVQFILNIFDFAYWPRSILGIIFLCNIFMHKFSTLIIKGKIISKDTSYYTIAEIATMLNTSKGMILGYIKKAGIKFHKKKKDGMKKGFISFLYNDQFEQLINYKNGIRE